ncbi:MAG: hypothetical protein R3D80_17955 [Paracoccaceae bacterium]
MLSKLVPITLISAVGLGIGVAAVADTAVGTIAQVSETCDALTLDDGSSFSFDDEAYADRLNCFKPGDEVSVTWRNVGEKMEAMTISPVSATLGERGVGTIATINAVGDTVTLSDGTTYVFEDGAFADRLHCFKPGDEVSITWRTVGDRIEGVAISPVNAAGPAMVDEGGGHECRHIDD